MHDLRNKPQSPHGAAPAAAPRIDRFEDTCATVFSTADGKELLRLMRARTIEKRLNHTSSDVDLRWHEAQREFVHSLEIAFERGIEARVKAAKS
jgi:hypothetical protein